MRRAYRGRADAAMVEGEAKGLDRCRGSVAAADQRGRVSRLRIDRRLSTDAVRPRITGDLVIDGRYDWRKFR